MNYSQSSPNSNSLQEKIEGYLTDFMLTDSLLTPFKDVVVRIDDKMNAPVAAYIVIETGEIFLNYKSDLLQKTQRAKQTLQLSQTPEELLRLQIYSTFKHEIGHNRIAPRTQDNYNAILSASYDYISKRELSKGGIVQKCSLVHNLFTDTILDTIQVHADEDYKLGKIVFNAIVNEYNSEEIKKSRMPRFLISSKNASSVHVALNQYLHLVDPKIRKILQSGSDFIGKNIYLERCITSLLQNRDLSREFLNDKVDAKSIEYMLSKFNDTSLWPRMVYDYTEAIYPLIKDKDIDNNRRSKFGRNSKNNSGSGSGKESEKQDKNSQGNSDGKGSKENPSKNSSPSQPQNNPTDPKKESGDNKDGSKKDTFGDNFGDDAKKDDKKGFGSKNDKNSNDKKDNFSEGEPDELDISYLSDERVRKYIEKLMERANENYVRTSQFVYLDNAYRNFSSKVYIQAKARKESESFSIMGNPSRVEPYDLLIRDVDWGSTRVTNNNGKNNIELYQREEIFQDNTINIIPSSGGIPDIGIIIDASPSMTYNPKTFSGEYHQGLVGAWSIFTTLEELGIARLLNFSSMRFGTKGLTEFSGWKKYSELDVVKSTLLNYGANDSTHLDIDKYRLARTSKKGNSLLIMLSDTWFNTKENAAELLAETKEIMNDPGMSLFLYQIGSDSSFARKARTMGVKVKNIQSVTDFSNDIIDMLDKFYGEMIS